jgi:23S rRNA pseudouridine2605 synthase
LASRRRADELIAAGRITVNDQRITAPGTLAVWGRDRILLDGGEIPGPSHRIYLMLNKPFGYISALSDPQGRAVVTDLVQDVGERVYPVGRLDFDTLGLLLLTNDGAWAHRMMHPRHHIPRTYKVSVEGSIEDSSLERLRRGLFLEDGFSGKARVTLLKREPERSILRITIHMGRSRIVRRMVDALGYRVVQLIRIAFGPLVLGDLKVGSYRHLSDSEVRNAVRPIHREQRSRRS